MNLLTVLKYFDLANNYREYQINLIKPYMKGEILEVGPGNGQVIENFIHKNEIGQLIPPYLYINFIIPNFLILSEIGLEIFDISIDHPGNNFLNELSSIIQIVKDWSHFFIILLTVKYK